MNNDSHPDAPQQAGEGFRFPGILQVTVVGEAKAGLQERVPAILQQLGLEVLHETLGTRPSRHGNYLSVTVDFSCPSRDLYQAAHAALRADPAIRYTH